MADGRPPTASEEAEAQTLYSSLRNIPCNLCGSSSTRLICHDGSFRIHRCADCSLIFVNPQPALAPGTDIEFHESDPVRPPLQPVAEPPSTEAFRREKAVVYRDGLDELCRRRPGRGRLLDVGCAFGLFLEQARAMGWDPYGLDVSRVAVDYANEQLGLANVRRGDLLTANLPDDHFQAVTLWNVLEHVTDPMRTMQEVRRILDPAGGVAVVRVPNMIVHDGLRMAKPALKPLLGRLGKTFPPYLGGISPPQHLFGFKPATLRALLVKAGFDRVDMRPAVPHGARSALGRLAWAVGSVGHVASRRRSTLTPAMIAYAQSHASRSS